MNPSTPQTGLVIIGRNEGRRLKACLRSVHQRSQAAVYVDSDSNDGSSLIAESLGFRVVELDPHKGPLNAARARNAGFHTLQRLLPNLEYIQFIDGDCVLDSNWISTAEQWLATHPGTAAVCGRRRERSAKRSLYTKLCDIEWNAPVGTIKSFGGDVLIRAKAFAQSGGYNETFPSGEEPDLALRLRKSGVTLERLSADMTTHDAGINGFHSWARRMIRGGYGAGLVFDYWRHKVPLADVPFGFLTRSTLLWTDGWLIGALTMILVGGSLAGLRGVLFGLSAALAIWIAQALRSARHLRGSLPAMDAFLYGIFTMLGKWPLRIGYALHRWDAWNSRTHRNLHYKP